jgi:uncharacterized surface protein with fasciclin (FAS1) repeats
MLQRLLALSTVATSIAVSALPVFAADTVYYTNTPSSSGVTQPSGYTYGTTMDSTTGTSATTTSQYQYGSTTGTSNANGTYNSNTGMYETNTYSTTPGSTVNGSTSTYTTSPRINPVTGRPDTRYEYQTGINTTTSSVLRGETIPYPTQEEQEQASKQSFETVTKRNVDTSIFAALLEKADLDRDMRIKDKFTEEKHTLFAPNNYAFAKLPAGTISRLMLPENKLELQELVMYHIVPGEVKAEQIQSAGTSVETIQGGQLTAQQTMEGGVVINGQAVVDRPNIATGEGTIHVIDQVLMPQNLVNGEEVDPDFKREKEYDKYDQ